MNRRHAVKALLLSSLLHGVSMPAARAAANRPGTVKPARLRSGHRIGIVAPASPAAEDSDVVFAADIVRSLGFEPVLGRHVFERNQYLAGDDEARAADVNAMFGDDRIDAVFCLRGGYGTQRMLPFLDYDLIASNPKVLTGYSDITGLLNAVHKRTGLVVFHGPIALQTFSDYTLAEYTKVLETPKAPIVIGAPPPFETRRGLLDRDNRLTTLTGGKARGRLVGGNLTLISTLMGTPYEPDFDGKVLFLEDVNEAPYRVDRMLTQLDLAGVIDRVAGIALGKFTEADDDGNSFSLEAVFRDRLAGRDVPVLRGLMVGHVEDQTTVPIGIEAELDADAGTLTLLETAVR